MRDWSQDPHTNTWHLKTLMISHILIMQHVMGMQKLSKSWPLWITSNNSGYTPIHLSARCWHTEIVKILAPLPDNPNANNNETTPIHDVALHGHREIVKILFPLTENPKAPKWGNTLMYFAALDHYSEIVKSLAQCSKCHQKWKNSKISWIFQYF